MFFQQTYSDWEKKAMTSFKTRITTSTSSSLKQIQIETSERKREKENA